MDNARKQKVEAQIQKLTAQLKESSADARLDLERRIDELRRLL